MKQKAVKRKVVKQKAVKQKAVKQRRDTKAVNIQACAAETPASAVIPA